jgi:hypothetical protein
MKLIVEHIEEVETLIENTQSGKSYFIKGTFMQAEVPNRNKRMYTKGILENQVFKYQTLINEKRSLGELGHPQGPNINLDRSSHLITELNWHGNDVYGKAKIIDTPMGRIAKNLLDEGVKLGVSSRGLGSLKPSKDGISEVSDDFVLSTVDIVADPSAPNAFVEGIMEGVEWIWDGGILKQQQVEKLEGEIEIVVSQRALSEEKKLEIMNKFFDMVSKDYVLGK